MLLWIIGIVFALILLGILFLTFLEGNTNFWAKQGVPSVNLTQYFSLYQRYCFKIPFHEAEHTYYKDLKSKNAKYGGIVLIRKPFLHVLDLDIIKNMLVKDFDHFVNRDELGLQDERFEKMLFSKLNQDWKDLRGTLSPAFSTSKIKRMFGVFDDSGKRMVNYLRDEIDNDPQIELRSVCGKYTMDVIASAVFGVQSLSFENENSPFVVHGKMLQDNFNWKLFVKFIIAFTLPKLARKLKFSFFNATAMEFLEKVVRENIRRRKEGGEKREDFLQLLIEAQAEAEEDYNREKENDIEEDFEHIEKPDEEVKKIKFKRVKFDEDTLIAQCTLFFLAGFDNLETVIMYTAFELAVQPEIQEKLFKILEKGKRESANGELSYDFVNQCQYLDMVISETLRKYPPTFRLERKCNKDYKIPGDDYILKKDSSLVFPIYGIHHDPDYFPDPEKFDPERFSPEVKNSRHPYAYLPFGVGPRMCIANRFAIVEGKTALANLVLSFKFSPSSKTLIPVKFNNVGVLKPIDGMWLNLEKRNN